MHHVYRGGYGSSRHVGRRYIAALEKQKLEYAIIEVDETIITLNKNDIVTQVTHERNIYA